MELTTTQICLLALGIFNLFLGLSNRIANYRNHKKLIEILVEEKKQSEDD